jgi:ubiquitin carboxyl-terminal hydrolase 5/13
VIRSFLGESLVDDFYSPAIGAKTVAKKSARLKTFPDYLLLSLSKYQMDQNWQPLKLNVQVNLNFKGTDSYEVFSVFVALANIV